MYFKTSICRISRSEIKLTIHEINVKELNFVNFHIAKDLLYDFGIIHFSTKDGSEISSGDENIDFIIRETTLNDKDNIAIYWFNDDGIYKKTIDKSNTFEPRQSGNGGVVGVSIC